jgi:hypothetical protein
MTIGSLHKFTRIFHLICKSLVKVNHECILKQNLNKVSVKSLLQSIQHVSFLKQIEALIINKLKLSQ